MDNKEIFDRLTKVLEDSGMNEARELLEEIKNNELARDPTIFGGGHTGFKINSADFINAFLDSDASEVESNNNDLIMFPKMNNGKITGVNVYYSARQEDQKLITNKVGDFSLNLSPETSGIVNTGGGSAVIEGISSNQHHITSHTNEQAFFAISNALQDDFISNTSKAHMRAPELLNQRELISAVNYDSYSHAKNYESHRTLALQTELKYETRTSGIVPFSSINKYHQGDGTEGTFRFLDPFNVSNTSTNRNALLSSVTEKGLSRDEFDSLLLDQGRSRYKKTLNRIINNKEYNSNLTTRGMILKNLASNNSDFMSTKNKDIARGVINDFLGTGGETMELKDMDTDALVDQIYQKLNLGEFEKIGSSYRKQLVNSVFGSNDALTKAELTSAINNSDVGNLGINNLNLAFESRKVEYSARQLQKAFGVNITSNEFGISSFATIEEIMNRDGKGGFSLTDEQRNLMSVGYKIENGNTSFTFGTITDEGEFKLNTIKSNYTEVDTNRVMEAQYKTRGLFIAEELLDSRSTESIVSSLESMNAHIAERDSSGFNNSISHLPSHLQTIARDAFVANEQLNISNIVNKDKFKGISNTLGSAVYGDLGIMNKLGARNIQSRDVLPDVTVSTGDGLFNLTNYLGDYYARQGGGLIKGGYLANQNAAIINQAENLSRGEVESKFSGRANISTRRSTQVMGFEILGMKEVVGVDPETGQSITEPVMQKIIGYDEATLISPTVSKSVSGETFKKHRVSLSDINDFLRKNLDGDETLLGNEINKVKNMEAAARARYLDEEYGFFGGYFKHKDKVTSEIKAMQAFEAEKIAAEREGRQVNVKAKRNLDVENLYYTKRTGASGFEGMNFKHAFDVDTAGIMEGEDGGIILPYYDITRATTGTKFHGYSHIGKYTVSGVMNNMDVSGREVGVVGAFKSQKRGWGGGMIVGTIKAGMEISAEHGKEREFLNSLENSGILEVLGLQIDSSGKVMTDTNVTSFTSPEEVLTSARKLIDNPALHTMKGARDLERRMSSAGYNDWNSLLLDINERYETVMQSDGIKLKDKDKLIGEKILQINGREYMVDGALFVDSYAISGADQTFTFGNAIRLGRMESRMLRSKGLTALDDLMGGYIASAGTKFSSQLTSAGSVDDLVFSALRTGTNSMNYSDVFTQSLVDDKNKQVVRLNVDAAMGQIGPKNVGKYAPNGAGGFKTMFGENFDIISEIRNANLDPESSKSKGVYKRLINTLGGDVKSSKNFKKLKSNLEKGVDPTTGINAQDLYDDVKGNILGKGVLANVDKNNALYNAYDSVSGKLDRVIPTIVYEGEGVDNLNRNLQAMFDKKKLFDGEELLESSFDSYKNYVIKQSKTGDLTMNESQRRAFHTTLQEYRAKNKHWDVGFDLLDRIANTKDLDEAARLMNMMDGNFINFHNLTSGLFSDQYGEEFLGGINRLFSNTSKMSTLKNLNTFETAMNKALELEDATSRGQAINAAINKLALYEKDWESMNKAEREIFLEVSKLTKGSNEVASLMENLNTLDPSTGEYNDHLTAINKEISRRDREYATDDVAGFNVKMERQKDKLVSGLFKSIYTKEADVVENFTKKATMFTDNLKYTVTNSLTGQWSEGTDFLNEVADKIKSDLSYAAASGGKVSSIKKLNSYRDLTEVFGEDLTQVLFFKHGEDVSGYLNKAGELDITKSRQLHEAILGMEDVALLNVNGIAGRNAELGVSLNTTGGVVNNALEKANIGIGMRNPVQSAEHVSMFAGVGVDLNSYKDDTKNFVIKALRKSGFGQSESGMMLGKKTVLKFNGDFDGDKFYFGILNNKLDSLDNDGNERLKRQMLQSFLTSNDIGPEHEALLSKLGLDMKDEETAATFKFMKEYRGHSREMSSINLQDALSTYNKTVAAVYGDPKATAAYKKLSRAKGDIEALTVLERDSLTDAFHRRFGYSMAPEDILKDLSKNSTSGINVYKSIQQLEKSFKGANIDKSGAVYTTVNNLRNIETVLGTKDIESDFIDQMMERARTISGETADHSNNVSLLQKMAEELGLEDVGTDSKIIKSRVVDVLSQEQEKIRKYQGLSSMLSNNAIEMGVISAKNDQDFIFSLIEQNAIDHMGRSGAELAEKSNKLKYLEMFTAGTADTRNYDELETLFNEIRGDKTSNSWKILETISSEKGVDLESGTQRHILAAMVFAGEENIKSVTKFNKTLSVISDKYKIKRSSGQGVVADFAKFLGIDNVELTRKGRMQNAWSATKQKAKAMFFKEEDHVVSKTVKPSGVLKSRTGKSINTKAAKEIVDSVTSNKAGLAVGIGAVALSAFVGYNIGKSRVRSYNEQAYQDELGLGENDLGYNFSSPTDLGY